MDRASCGDCEKCIARELDFLSRMEGDIYAEAQGDVTRYLNLMAVWVDVFVDQGIPR